MDNLAKYVPGFGAYRSEQKRRDDDLAVRKYLADRLQECKRDLQAFMAPLVDQANFAAITCRPTGWCSLVSAGAL